MCWERGRPARSEREARKDCRPGTARLMARLRAGRQRSQQIAWVVPGQLSLLVRSLDGARQRAVVAASPTDQSRPCRENAQFVGEMSACSPGILVAP